MKRNKVSYIEMRHRANSAHLATISAEVFAQALDLDTKPQIPASTRPLRQEYFDRLSADNAESLSLLFAALSAQCQRRAHAAHNQQIEELTGKTDPRAAYLANLKNASITVAKLLRDYHDLDREQAIIEAARMHDLTPGTVEKAMIAHCRDDRTLRRMEIERQLCLGVPRHKIAESVGVERTTVWRIARQITHAGQPSRPALPQPQPR